MSNLSLGAMAKVDLVNEMMTNKINHETLKTINDYETVDSLEFVVHENLRLIVPKIINKQYIYDLIDEINKIKPINKNFYQVMWTYDIESDDFSVTLPLLKKAYSLADDTVDKKILEELLCMLITITLKSQLLDSEVLKSLETYKLHLKSLMEEVK